LDLEGFQAIEKGIRTVNAGRGKFIENALAGVKPEDGMVSGAGLGVFHDG
jgi:hypothetical protein